MLTADAEVNVGTGCPAEFGCHLDEFADADLVETGEGIGFVNLLLVVGVQELACVVTAETEGHLGEVVGAEGEELRFGGDCVGGERRTRDLYHGADLVLHLHACVRKALVGGGNHDALYIGKLFDFADERNHDFGDHLPVGVLLLHRDCRLHDRLGLHDRDFGIGDRETAASVTHHGVELVQTGDDGFDGVDGHIHILGKRLDVGLFGGHELMERRVEEADGDGSALEGFVKRFEVALLHGQKFGKRLFALLDGVGDYHLTHRHDSVGLEEHMFGAAQTDAFRAESARLTGVSRGVGVGPDMERTVLVRPFHDSAEITGKFGFDGGQFAREDFAGGTVEGNPVSFVESLSAEGEHFLLFVDVDVAATGDAAGAHAAGNDRRVRGHAAANGEDTLRVVHTFDVFGRGLETDEDDSLFTLVDDPVGGVFCGEHDFAAGSAGRSGKRSADGLGFLVRRFVETGVQERVKLFGVEGKQSLLFVEHTLVHEVAGNLDCRRRGTLAVSGLEHEEFAFLDSELHVLHIPVVVFQSLDDVDELGIHLGVGVLEVGDGGRSAHAGDDIFALSVHEVLAEETLLARCGVSGERNARTGGVAHVAEHHHLDIDGGAPVAGDVVHTTVVNRTVVVPAAENGFDRAHELFLGILREILADFGLVFGLELLGERLEVVGVEFGVEFDALLLFHLVDELFEIFLADFHDDIGVHLNEAAVAVVSKTGVARLFGESDDDFVVETEVEDGVHHAGHRSACAGADGNEKRIVERAELLADEFLEFGDVFHNFRLNPVADFLTVEVVLRARLGGDGEALRHGHTELGHFGEVGAFAAEKRSSVAVELACFLELINELFH